MKQMHIPTHRESSGTAAPEKSPTTPGSAAPKKDESRASTRSHVTAASRFSINHGPQYGQTLGQLDGNSFFAKTKKTGDVPPLWTEVKRRCIRKYRSLDRAFKAVDMSGDDAIGLLDMARLLKNLNIKIDQRNFRMAFLHESGPDKEMNFDEFVQCLMKQTLDKLRSQIVKFEQKRMNMRRNMDLFLDVLIHSSEENRQAAVKRFQNKLTMEFCRAFWGKIRQFVIRRHEPELKKETFLRLMNSIKDTRFQAYEQPMLKRIFDKVDRRKIGSANQYDLITVFIFLSAKMDASDKLRILFEIWDADGDECVTHHQLLQMFFSNIVNAPIASQDEVKRSIDLQFYDLVSLNDAGTMFCEVIHQLHRNDTLDSILNFDEVWAVFKARPDLLKLIMPDTPYIRWVLPNHYPWKLDQSVDAPSPRVRKFSVTADDEFNNDVAAVKAVRAKYIRPKKERTNPVNTARSSNRDADHSVAAISARSGTFARGKNGAVLQESSGASHTRNPSLRVETKREFSAMTDPDDRDPRPVVQINLQSNFKW